MQQDKLSMHKEEQFQLIKEAMPQHTTRQIYAKLHTELQVH